MVSERAASYANGLSVIVTAGSTRELQLYSVHLLRGHSGDLYITLTRGSRCKNWSADVRKICTCCKENDYEVDNNKAVALDSVFTVSNVRSSHSSPLF